jgi:hypothetical protein
MKTPADIIDAFGYALLAQTVKRPPGTVAAWKSRGSIPASYWQEIVDAAQKLDLPVTFKILAAAHARPRSTVRRKAA